MKIRIYNTLSQFQKAYKLQVQIGQAEKELYEKQFKIIEDIMLGILSIPDSNADFLLNEENSP